ncbi:DNA polymerase Y family protein [Streptomyces mirabilis]|uniref:DNA polymerase Y family protein n=1 Tax=Streptomyces mirabilis TaxID=68239 RepID=UPI0033BE6C90
MHFHEVRNPALLDQLLTLIEDFTPVWQPLPPDTVDVDLTGSLTYFDDNPQHIAQMIQIRALALYGVRTTVGGGNTVQLATMAAAATVPGRRVTIVAPTDAAIAAFLRPRRVADLPGIGPATAKALARYGISTIGELASTPATVLTRILGSAAGRQLHARARGDDPRPVSRTALVRSTSASHTFARDELDAGEHRRALLGLADELGLRLRTKGEVCRSLTLTVRYADGSTTTTRSRALPEASHHSPVLAAAARDLYAGLGLQRARVAQIAVRAEQLAAADDAHHQLQLGDTDDKAHRLKVVADAARSRFGTHVVKPAALRNTTRKPVWTPDLGFDDFEDERTALSTGRRTPPQHLPPCLGSQLPPNPSHSPRADHG